MALLRRRARGWHARCPEGGISLLGGVQGLPVDHDTAGVWRGGHGLGIERVDQPRVGLALQLVEGHAASSGGPCIRSMKARSSCGTIRDPDDDLDLSGRVDFDGGVRGDYSPPRERPHERREGAWIVTEIEDGSDLFFPGLGR